MLDRLFWNPELRAQAALKARQHVANECLWPGTARSIESANTTFSARPLGTNRNDG